MPRTSNTIVRSFHFTINISEHYICARRNSDNLHNAVSIGYSLVARVMADGHLSVVSLQVTDVMVSLV